MFKRLRLLLTVICTAITSVILIGMAFGSLAYSERQLRERGSAGFSSSLNSVLFYLNSQQVLDHTWLSQTEANDGLMLFIRDNGKPLLYHGAAPREQRDRLSGLARETAAGLGFDASQPPESRYQARTIRFTLRDPLDGQDYYAALSSVPSSERNWLGLLLLKPMAPEQEQISLLRRGFFGLTAFAILLLGIFSWFFTTRAIRPVEESRRRQIEFVSAASHELRSPLAVIQASAAAIERAGPERAERFAGTIGQECVRMSRLVDDMLTLASADNSSWSVVREETDLETLLLNTAERFEPPAGRKGIRVSVELPEEPLPKCRCDQNRIGQVLAILLDNAISYTGGGGRIVLSAARTRGGVELRVADNGPGIPDSEKGRIFDRFYRADAARSHREHYGLGLSIAQEIARLHRGRLNVTDTPGGGATFHLSLPLDEKIKI